MWSVFNSSTPVARKAHRCQECGATIRPGERYSSYSGLWEGEWESGKNCWPCHEAELYLFIQNASYADEGYTIGELDVELAEEARNAKSFAAYRHVVGIRRRRREARQLHS